MIPANPNNARTYNPMIKHATRHFEGFGSSSGVVLIGAAAAAFVGPFVTSESAIAMLEPRPITFSMFDVISRNTNPIDIQINSLHQLSYRFMHCVARHRTAPHR